MATTCHNIRYKAMTAKNKSAIDELLGVMKSLRDPQTGCPWDLEQSFETIAPYTIEEAYEVADAIARGSAEDIKDELGDLLLQVVFHAQMAEEQGLFSFNDVAQSIADKMIRRHPNVFGNEEVADAQSQTKAWEDQKAREREEKAKKDGRIPSALDDVTMGLPALMRAQKLQKRASRVGFDWPDISGVFAKIREELDEVEDALSSNMGEDKQREELGDLLFACTNLARFMKQDAEDALLTANAKFERRFRAMEVEVQSSKKAMSDCHLDELERLWQQAKNDEKDGAETAPSE